MTRITGLDCAVMCNLLNTPRLGGSMRVAKNDENDRAGLRGYGQFNKHKHTHTHTDEGSMRVEKND